MDLLKVLVLELLAVDGFAACAVTGGEVAALDHEGLDDAVEGGAFVVEGLARGAGAFFAGAEGAKVFGGFGDDWDMLVRE